MEATGMDYLYQVSLKQLSGQYLWWYMIKKLLLRQGKNKNDNIKTQNR